MTVEVVTSCDDLTGRLATVRDGGGTVGFVPTMGHLHEGHGSLVDASVAATDLTVVSVFVNPLQFGAGEDLADYPRDLAADVALCEARGADLVFDPAAAEVYPDGSTESLAPVGVVARPLEGECRPTHFVGVVEVVSRLFRTVGPCHTFFGEKDFQQLQVVRRLVGDLGLPVEVVGCATSREPDGLARSSRNTYLSDAERAAAPVLYRTLTAAADAVARPGWDRADVEVMMAARLAVEPTASTDYAVVVDPTTLGPPVDSRPGDDLRLLVACRFGRARLIDNVGAVAG